MADLRTILTEHSESFDRDCMQHDGCMCGWDAPVPDYEGDDAMERNHAAWVEHVVEIANG